MSQELQCNICQLCFAYVCVCVRGSSPRRCRGMSLSHVVVCMDLPQRMRGLRWVYSISRAIWFAGLSLCRKLSFEKLGNSALMLR